MYMNTHSHIHIHYMCTYITIPVFLVDTVT